MPLPEPVLTDGQVVLRPVRPGDADDLWEAIHGDEGIERWTRIPFPYRREYARHFAETVGAGFAAGTDAAFAMTEPAGGRLVGCVGLHRIGAAGAPRSALLPDEVGYWVAASERGKGIARRAVALLTGWAIEDVGRPSLNLQVGVGNEASFRVASSVGYHYLGIAHRSEVDDDTTRDYHRFTMTRADWEHRPPASP